MRRRERKPRGPHQKWRRDLLNSLEVLQRLWFSGTLPRRSFIPSRHSPYRAVPPGGAYDSSARPWPRGSSRCSIDRRGEHRRCRRIARRSRSPRRALTGTPSCSADAAARQRIAAEGKAALDPTKTSTRSCSSRSVLSASRCILRCPSGRLKSSSRMSKPIQGSYPRSRRLGSTNHLVGELFKSVPHFRARPDSLSGAGRHHGPDRRSDLDGSRRVHGASLGLNQSGGLRILAVTSAMPLLGAPDATVARPDFRHRRRT